MYEKVMMALAVMLLVVSSASIASADSYEYCLNDSYKFWQREIIYNNGSMTTTHTFNYTQNCTYGCDNGRCLPEPSPSQDIAVVLGLMAAAFFFLYGGLKLDKQSHGVIQVLFMFVGILFIVISLAALIEISSYSSLAPLETAVQNGYRLSMYVFWFLLFYFIVLFMYRVLVTTGKIQPIKWGL